MFTLPHVSPRDVAYTKNQTSVLFVDMQNIWISSEFNQPLRAEQTNYYYSRLNTVAIPNQQRLLAAMRHKQQNVLHTIIESLTADGRDRSLDHKLSNMHLPKGCAEAQVIPELKPNENEIILPKTSSGVFNSTAIDYVLRNLDTKHLIVCGVITEQCVDMAVRDAADRGYLVTLVEDGCATYSHERHYACLNAIKGYCWIADTATVIHKINQL